MDGIGEGHQLVEHLRALRQLLVSLTLLVQQADGLAIASLRVIVTLHLPVKVAQLQQEHALLRAAAGGLLVARLVGGNGLGRVVLREVDIADGIVHLVEVVFVVVRGGHALQTADHLLVVRGGHHLGLGDAGVELHLVGRILGGHAAVCLVGLPCVAQRCLDLSHDKPLAGFLRLAVLTADDLPQQGHGALQLARAQVVVGHGLVPCRLCAVVDGVAVLVADDVLGIVYPVQLGIAAGQPSTGNAVDGGLRLVEAAHVAEGGGGLVEGSLLELRLAQHQPGFPDEGIILAAAEPLNVFLSLPSALLPLRAGLDAVLLDGFLHLLHGAVEVAAAQGAALLVGYGEERQRLGIVVLVAFLLVQRAVDKGQLAIVEGVVFCGKRLPEAAPRSVLLHGTGSRQQQDGHKQHVYDNSSHVHI